MIDKIGPYRVYERLGVGGMGEVYKAYDDRLDRWVAIKRIRPDREDAEDNRERFKREARATARLNHPSIVHLYGIFQDGDSDCIVMEYVDGKTLDQLLSEGPMDPLRVANLGHEIAAGLAEAHANGILHRDLKAENIMISPRGRAKILDFGLAKPILRSELDPVLTGKGQLVGTSRAMSPEYVSGEAVDHRSDLFSMGVLLYECLTGHSPFKAHNTLATLKQVMMHKQTSIKVLNPRIPVELSDLIDQLLEKDPSNRPQNAHEVALAFGRLTGQVSSGIVDIPGGLPPGNMTGGSSTLTNFSASDTVLDLRPRHRWMTLLAVVVVLVASAFFLGKFFTKPGLNEPDLPPEERIYLVLADFDNRTDEEDLGAILNQALRAMLEQSRSSSVLSRGQLNDALHRMQRSQDEVIDRELAREISKREGAARLISGAVSKFGTTYSISLEVVDPKTDETVFSFSERPKGSQELLADLEQGALEIRSYLGESVAQIEDSVPLAKVVTPNIEALRAYTRGLERLEDDRRPDEAITFFERAIELDPDFSIAHAKLGVIYSNREDRDKGLAHFNAAASRPERLSEVELFYVKAWLARWNGTPNDVIENWALMSELHPESPAAAYNLGQALWYYRNDFEAAAASFHLGTKVSRGALRDLGYSFLGRMYLALGLIGEARASLEGMVTEAEVQPLETLLALVDGKDLQVSQLPLQISGLSEGDRLLLLSLVALSNKDYGGSLVFLSNAEEWAIANGRLATRCHALIDRIAVEFFQGDGDDFKMSALGALSTCRAIIQPETKDFETGTFTLFAVVGKMLARQGFVSEAEEIASQLDKVVEEAGENVIWAAFADMLRGELLVARGEKQRAFRLLQERLETTRSFQVLESLAHSSEEEQVKGRLEEELAASRGLAVMECGTSCYGRGYSFLLHLQLTEQQ